MSVYKGTKESRFLGLKFETLGFRHRKREVACETINFGAAKYQSRGAERRGAREITA